MMKSNAELTAWLSNYPQHLAKSKIISNRYREVCALAILYDYNFLGGWRRHGS